MGSEQPLPEVQASSRNPLLANGTSQLPGANGEDSEGSGSESKSSASHVKVVDPVRVVKDDEGLPRKAGEAVKLVDRLERYREKSKEDPYVFEGDYQTIKNILHIKENPVYSAAFDEWIRQLKEIRVKLVEKESEKTDLTTQVYNIVGFFSVFQGVVLTAVSQLSSGSGDKCRKTWVPVLLSVVAAFVTLFALYKKFASLRLVEDLFVNPRKQRDNLQRRVDALLTHGNRFRFYKDYTKKETPKGPEETPKGPEETPKGPEETPKDPEETPKDLEETPKGPEETPKDQPKETPKSSQGSDVLHNGVLVSVVLFTGVFVLSYFVILCD